MNPDAAIQILARMVSCYDSDKEAHDHVYGITLDDNKWTMAMRKCAAVAVRGDFVTSFPNAPWVGLRIRPKAVAEKLLQRPTTTNALKTTLKELSWWANSGPKCGTCEGEGNLEVVCECCSHSHHHDCPDCCGSGMRVRYGTLLDVLLRIDHLKYVVRCFSADEPVLVAKSDPNLYFEGVDWRAILASSSSEIDPKRATEVRVFEDKKEK